MYRQTEGIDVVHHELVPCADRSLVARDTEICNGMQIAKRRELQSGLLVNGVWTGSCEPRPIMAWYPKTLDHGCSR